MKRLTERTEYGIVGNNDKVTHYPLYKVANNDPLDHGIVDKCFNKLANYEDLEEQGLLLKLPCKVGDTVFVLTGLEDDNIVHEGKCVGYTKNELRGWLIEVNYFGGYKSFESFAEIGKSVFLTKEQAEQALAEMKGVCEYATNRSY